MLQHLSTLFNLCAKQKLEILSYGAFYNMWLKAYRCFILAIDRILAVATIMSATLVASPRKGTCFARWQVTCCAFHTLFHRDLVLTQRTLLHCRKKRNNPGTRLIHCERHLSKKLWNPHTVTNPVLFEFSHQLSIIPWNTEVCPMNWIHCVCFRQGTVWVN